MSEKIATRAAYGEALVSLAEQYPELVVLDADLSGSTMTKAFSKAHPERFFKFLRRILFRYILHCCSAIARCVVPANRNMRKERCAAFPVNGIPFCLDIRKNFAVVPVHVAKMRKLIVGNRGKRKIGCDFRGG